MVNSSSIAHGVPKHVISVLLWLALMCDIRDGAHGRCEVERWSAETGLPTKAVAGLHSSACMLVSEYTYV